MAGNEIAQLAAVIKLNDGNVGQKLEIIKKGLGATDQRFNALTKAVNDSAVKMQSAKVALDKYRAELGNLNKATDEQKAKLNQLQSAYTQQKLAVAQSTLELKKYKAEAAAASMTTKGLTGAIAALGLTIEGVLTGGLIVLVTALSAISLGATKTAGEFEQLAVSFDVLIGNSTKAAAFTDELIALANVTPLTTQGLAKNAQVLLAMGESLENVIPDLKMLGDIARGNQEDLNGLTLTFAQIGSTGRLTGDNLRELTYRGFNPLLVISQKTGKSMSQLREEMEDGQISYSMVKDALKEVTSEGGRFYNLMNKQSQTLNGRLSTLADNVALIAKNIGDLFLPSAKKAVDVMIRLSDGALKWANSLRIANSQMNAMGINDLNIKLGQLKKRQEELNEIPKGSAGLFRSREEIDKDRINTAKSIKYAEDRIKALQKEEKQFNSVSKSTGATTGFVNSTKEVSEKKRKTKKGKSTETILSERAQMIQAQSDFEIAQNDLVEEQMLLKKIETQQKVTALYKKGSLDYIQSKTLELEYANQIEDLKTKKAKEEADKKKELLEKAREEEQKAAEKVAGAITDSLKSAVEGTKTLSEAFKDMLSTMAINILKSGLEKKLTSMFMGSSTAEKGGTGVLSNALMMSGNPYAMAAGGIAKMLGFANGGNPPVNKPFVVGERGPEIMQVGSSSKVWSNNQSQNMMAGTNQQSQQMTQPVIITNQINVKSLDGKEAYNVLMENKPAIQKMVADGIKLNQNNLRNTVKGV